MIAEAFLHEGLHDGAHSPSGGETLTNPVTGDRLTVLSSPWRDLTPALTVRLDLAPGAAGSPLHIHRRICETFSVLGGALNMEVGGKGRRILRAGERIEVPPGMAHSFRNGSDGWTAVLATVSPGERFERFLLSMHGLAAEGRTDAAGLPRNPMHLALLLSYADFEFAGMPGWLQRPLIDGLAALGRLAGAERGLRHHWVNETAARTS